MSLKTGKKVICRDFTELPITDKIIDLVHSYAPNANPDADPDDFLFEWAADDPIANFPPPPAVLGAEEGAPANASADDATADADDETDSGTESDETDSGDDDDDDADGNNSGDDDDDASDDDGDDNDTCN